MDKKTLIEKVKNIEAGNLLLIGVVGMIATYILGIATDIFFLIPCCLMVIFLIILLAGGIKASLDKKIEKNKVIENMNEFQTEYDKYTYELGVTKSDIQVTLFEFTEKRAVFPAHIPHYLWIDNNTLKLFPLSKYYKEWETNAVRKPDISKLKLKTIPIESILYFEEIGELRKYASIAGGGTSLKGALLGYVLADEVGAIIGSRESIKTEIISEDDRRVELIYKNSENEMVNLEFEHDAYNAFKKLISSKELRRIVGLNTVQYEDNQSYKKEPQNVKERLQQLSDLNKEGLITEEDFLEQKKKILDSL